MAPYRRIQTRIWNDAKFATLSERGKLVFLFLLTHPNMTMLGAMRATIPGLATELRIEAKRFREAFQEASAKGMVKHDDKAAFVWLPNFLRYNRPDNPNVVKAWPDALELIPECPLKYELHQYLKSFVEGLPENFGKAFRERLPEPFPNCMPNQEQEQEQEQEKPPCPPLAAAGRSSASGAIETWNQAVKGTNLPSARLTEKRQKVIDIRLKEPGWFEDFTAACSYVRSSNFHRGRNDRNWVANLDYVLQVGKATELAEKATAKPSSVADGKHVEYQDPAKQIERQLGNHFSEEHFRVKGVQ